MIDEIPAIKMTSPRAYRGLPMCIQTARTLPRRGRLARARTKTTDYSGSACEGESLLVVRKARVRVENQAGMSASPLECGLDSLRKNQIARGKVDPSRITVRLG